MFAVRSGNNEVVEKCLNLTANPFSLNGMGQSALDLAHIHQPKLVETIQTGINQWMQHYGEEQIKQEVQKNIDETKDWQQYVQFDVWHRAAGEK